jgi:hypothetical protein
VQAAHVAAVAASASGTGLDGWVSRTLVLHSAHPQQLVDIVEQAGGDPSCSGHANSLSWFVEPDLFHELTSVAWTDETVAEHAGDLPLWSTQDGEGRRLWRDEARTLARQADKDGITTEDIWAYARDLGGPHLRANRRRAYWLLVRGREPP